jgi:Protein of unknown function (DUF1569)
MKNILNEAEYRTIRNRIENLKPDAQRQWGKMDVAQMLAHCNAAIEIAAGITPYKDESNFITRTLLKWVIMSSVKKGAFGKNAPTAKSIKITHSVDFEKEKQRMLGNLDVLYKKGNAGALGDHPAFRAFTNEEWGGLQYVHLDHHLTQFSS